MRLNKQNIWIKISIVMAVVSITMPCFAATFDLVFVTDQTTKQKFSQAGQIDNIVKETVTGINDLWSETDIQFTARYNNNVWTRAGVLPIMIKKLDAQRSKKSTEITIALSANYFGANDENVGGSLQFVPVVMATVLICKTDRKFYKESLIGTIAHELGHVFGAGHRDQNDVLMSRAIHRGCGEQNNDFTEQTQEFLQRRANIRFDQYPADQLTEKVFADFTKAGFDKEYDRNYHPYFDTLNYLLFSIDAIEKVKSLDKLVNVFSTNHLIYESCMTSLYTAKGYFDFDQQGLALSVFNRSIRDCQDNNYFMAYYHYRYAMVYDQSKSYDNAHQHIQEAIFYLNRHYPYAKTGTGQEGAAELQVFLELQKNIANKN
ncbi:MAG: hypothetical protein KDK51_08810 [Deltaproteobacteria bacterium]|nr:hypothetical protein [Deltaproteobacteria bacterium]